MLDHALSNAIRSQANGKIAIDAIIKLLEENGCDCDCGHGSEDHDDDCERCLGCRVSDVVQEYERAEQDRIDEDRARREGEIARLMDIKGNENEKRDEGKGHD
jgi:hypothetical protein